MTSLVNSHFLPIKEDPADALVDKMIKGAGIDSADSTLGPAMNWKKPALPDETPKAQIDHNRFNQHDLVKLQPVVSATGLVAPKEWKSTAEMEAPSSRSTQNEPVQSVLANNEKLPEQLNTEFYHEIVSKHQSSSETDDGEQSQKMISSTVEQELQSLKPKEVVKVFDRDTKLRESMYRGLRHLGKSLDKYGPITQEKFIDPNFSVHHGSFRPTTAPTFSTTTTEAMVADATNETRYLSKQVQENDLTSSLKAMFPKQRNVALKRPLIDETSMDEVPRHSVMDSVHHSKHHSIRFPIRPEDIHHAESTTPEANSTSQSHLNASIASSVSNPVKQQHDGKTVGKLKGHRSKSSSKTSIRTPSDKLTNLFDANSDSGGQMCADDVQKVLRFMKVQSGWNWHPFDLNGDGKLSRQEFLNAARVAQHFKISKK